MNQIYGLAPALEALRARRRKIHKILIASGGRQGRLNELIETARRAGVAVEQRDRHELDELTRHANHQGVVALVAPPDRKSMYVEADEILESMGASPLIVLLDGVEDPHNLGAILRTCECAGVDGVFIPEHRAAGLSETVAKTSAGAVEYVRVARVTNLVPLIGELKDRGLWVVGVEGGTGNIYSDFDLRVPLAIVMGSEGKGVRRLVREKCDAVVSIPMRGKINSLNVSVAAGIVLFEAVRQRLK
ncbi:MAG TPA: 23S rRNA (guanosine(2251)-2'-O)-methyltransferase RlmB [Blastocatellia bacterium]